MAIVENSQLGKDTTYVDHYDPSLLFPIARSENRSTLGIEEEALPFSGEDVWTSFEVSWLELSGKPRVAIGVFRIPCNSPNIIESKSFKLYLNSFNQERYKDADSVLQVMEKDLSAAAGATVNVELRSLSDIKPVELPAGQCIDSAPAENFVYEPSADLLELDAGLGADPVEETLYSDLLRSNCPVTGQPDWGTVVIRYRGPKINQSSLLRYVVSFRTCQDFHEHCAEHIFTDLMAKCGCEALSVMARYTRRGGLDINPYRVSEGFVNESDGALLCPNTRFVRQ
jgi:7-cyano-7-deazaguanine reductase